MENRARTLLRCCRALPKPSRGRMDEVVDNRGSCACRDPVAIPGCQATRAFARDGQLRRIRRSSAEVETLGRKRPAPVAVKIRHHKLPNASQPLFLLDLRPKNGMNHSSSCGG